MRALDDVAAHGDNDVLPFDLDTRFIADRKDDLATALLDFADIAERKTAKECENLFHSLPIFSERLLAPSGTSGFRITTKIHPVWNAYLNALCVAIAERHEPTRNERAHSYRLAAEGPALFQDDWSWRRFREQSAADCAGESDAGIVVQTDISGFYEHIYHHRLENYIQDIMPVGNISVQVNVLLQKLSSGRSFGIPVGSQGSRILAEVLMSSVDRTLAAEGIRWRRYVDDFVLVADSQSEAYRALGVLANALGDLGLGLNRNKTMMLSPRHYKEYIDAQLNGSNDESRALREVDLYFDPYSDAPDEDYQELKETVGRIDVEFLLRAELEKGQPDGLIVSQVGRALRLMDSDQALAVCRVLLSAKNLHSFRGNWPSIMRGLSAILGDDSFSKIWEPTDRLVDDVCSHSQHLLSVDTNQLHYLRAVRHRRTNKRAEFVLASYKTARAASIRRACIDCWREWRDRDRFISLRNEWASMVPEEQRMLWLAAGRFGDDGDHFRKQVKKTISSLWNLGIERSGRPTFAQAFADWASGYA